MCVWLAPKAGIEIPADVTDAEKLKFVQAKLEAGDEGALKIWQSMGVYLGYGIAHYADFYDMKHVLILGRCTSGRGGDLLMKVPGRFLRSSSRMLSGKDRTTPARREDPSRRSVCSGGKSASCQPNCSVPINEKEINYEISSKYVRSFCPRR